MICCVDPTHFHPAETPWGRLLTQSNIIKICETSTLMGKTPHRFPLQVAFVCLFGLFGSWLVLFFFGGSFWGASWVSRGFCSDPGPPGTQVRVLRDLIDSSAVVLHLLYHGGRRSCENLNSTCLLVCWFLAFNLILWSSWGCLGFGAGPPGTQVTVSPMSDDLLCVCIRKFVKRDLTK